MNKDLGFVLKDGHKLQLCILQLGHTHSCHHPKTHQVPLRELKEIQHDSSQYDVQEKKKKRDVGRTKTR